MEKVKATFTNPVKLGLYWQLIWVNIVSTLSRIYVGINLEKFRDVSEGYTGNELYWAIEYSFNVGHWHILATLTAMMVAFIAIDYYSITGKIRYIARWALTLGTVFGFGFATKYMLRNPGADYDCDFWMIDLGLALLFLGVGILAIYIIIDAFVNKIKAKAK